ncbi:MAG TPA: class I SAM-dependent methyltransferase [Methanobacteriaceae archaeon]|nr:class I SAM-dependent methyltransferase [Methanobacteriaceae archaeon]
MNEKYKLIPTAALVMHWAEELYQRKPANHFLDTLDLSAGDNILKECNETCNWYKEVILNRNNLIYHLISHQLLETQEKPQIVILAAGMCPLSINLLYQYGSKIAHIFEIDKAHMEKKSRIYKEMFPEYMNKLTCFSFDITRRDLINHLYHEEHFKIERPTLVIAEGISYYISPTDLKKLIIDFSSPQRMNRFIVDYQVPYNEVNDNKRHIPQNIFGIIRDHCQVPPPITTYTQNDLEYLFEEVWGKVDENYDLKNMEFLRKGKNEYFKTRKEGWIECVVGKI